MDNLETICKAVTKLTAVTGAYILNERKSFTEKNIEEKGHNDLVSYVDKTAEEQIVSELRTILPEAGFITEENTSNEKGKEYNWIIDPLDGTTNFIHGMPCFCISIGLIKGDEMVVGVVHELNLDECFYAWKSGGAYVNSKPIHVSSTRHLKDSLLATGFPYHDFSLMKPYMEVFDYCMRNTHGLRRLGSAAADLAYVAAGRFEAFYEYGLNAWDVAAGCLLVEEAGGTVTDFRGGRNFVFGREVNASNGKVGTELLDVIKSKFNY